jgi:hypothetical protein
MRGKSGPRSPSTHVSLRHASASTSWRAGCSLRCGDCRRNSPARTPSIISARKVSRDLPRPLRDRGPRIGTKFYDFLLRHSHFYNLVHSNGGGDLDDPHMILTHERGSDAAYPARGASVRSGRT